MFIRSLLEITYPEYRGRHLFTAKLRLVVFLVFWFLYVVFLKEWMEETRHIAIIVSCSFLLTTICYYNIYRERWVKISFIGEVLSDVVALTAVIYLTGGPASSYFTIYIFYSVIAGMLYNHIVAFAAASVSAVVYVAFSILCHMGIIPPMLVAIDGMVPPAIRSYYFHPLMLGLFLALAVYTTKIAHHFTQVRERMLEARNKELTALHRMSNTIRSMISLEKVIAEVLQGVLEGLDFEVALLTYFDKSSKRVRCFPPRNNPLIQRVEEVLKFPIDQLSIPINSLSNTAFRSIKQNQVIFRRDLADLVVGLQPAITPEQAGAVQKVFGIKKIVGVPLVAEGAVLGALFGFASQPFVGERTVQTLESFANQAALAIQTAQLIEELKKKNVELQEANRVKSEFLATMSHELRTPLTAIIGFSELLIEGVMGELNDEQKESVREVLNNGATLLDMINNLLDLAKADSGKMELVKGEFDLADLLDRTRRTIASLIQRRHHTLVFDVAKGMPPVNADEKRVQQIILNLLSNATKFTPENGRITISANYWQSVDDAVRAGRTVKAGNNNFKDGLFCVSVSDNGIGIKPEHLEGIFDIFSQVDSSITRSYEGTGLGLALAKQFVELHGGVIWAESEFGKGAAFTFLLPRK